MATLAGIAVRPAPRESMHTLKRARVTCEDGLVDDTRGSATARQVTVLSAQSWDYVCGELSRTLPWTTRRANLLVDGIVFAPTDEGRRLRVGALTLLVRGETTPCSRMEDQVPGLQSSLAPHWRGGVCCEVLNAGDIAVGDAVEWLDD